jgi:hypothetical protein
MVIPRSAIPVNFGIGKNGRGKRRLRERLFVEQDGRCYWCKDDMELEHFIKTEHGNLKENPRFASIEHLLPKYRGGMNGAANCVAAHAHCNHKRASKRWPHDPVYGNLNRKQPAPKAFLPLPREPDIPIMTDAWCAAITREMDCDWPWLRRLAAQRVRDVGWGPW